MKNQTISIAENQNLNQLILDIKNNNFLIQKNKINFIRELIIKNPNIIRDIKELLYFIDNLNLESNLDKTDLTIETIKANPYITSEVIDIKSILNITKDLKINDFDCKICIIILFMDLNKIIAEKIKNLHQLLEISKTLKSSGVEMRLYFAMSAIDNNPEIINRINSFKELSELNIKLEDEYGENKISLITDIVKKNSKIINNFEDLINLIKEIKFNNEQHKINLILEIIKQDPAIIKGSQNKQNIANTLIELIKEAGIRYKADLICQLIKEADIFKMEINKDKNNANLIKNINYNLYNNSHLKLNLLKKAINITLINKNNFFRSGFDDLTGQALFDVIEFAKNLKVVNNEELFNYFGIEVFDSYKSFKETLTNKTIKDILIDEKTTTNIARIVYEEDYHENKLHNFKNKSAISLITYCDIFNKTEILATAIKEEIKQELKQKFYPAGFKILDIEELVKISNLIQIEPESLKEKYLNIGELAKIFTAYLEKIPNFIDSINNIKDSEILNESTIFNKNDNYIDLLKLIAPEQKININKYRDKLNNAVKDNRDSFFYILSQKDGKEIIKNIIMGAEDGCQANIANQINNQALKIAIDNSDIEDEKHKYSLIKTYNIFMEKIIIPIINKGGDNLGGSGSANFLRDNLSELNNKYISLSGLYKYCEHNSSLQVKIIGNKLYKRIENYCTEGKKINYEEIANNMNQISSFIALKKILEKKKFSSLIKNYSDLDKTITIDKIKGKIIKAIGDLDKLEPENENIPQHKIILKNFSQQKNTDKKIN